MSYKLEGDVRCPGCGKPANGQSLAFAADEIGIARAFDYSICAYCNAVNQFDENVVLRRCITGVPPEMQEEVRKVRLAIQLFHALGKSAAN